jgi:hypothetical protein
MSCPRCLAKSKIQVPLTFELGWQRQGAEARRPQNPEKTSADAQPALR